MQGSRLSNIKTKIIASNPFIGSMLMHLDFVEDYTRPTFATNGRSLFYNPLFSRTLSDNELKFVLGHEACHVIALHHLRRGSKDPKIFNYAADYVVNNILVKEKVGIMPEDVLYDPVYDNMSVEEVYKKLEQEALKSSESNGSDNNQSKEQDSGGNENSKDSEKQQNPVQQMSTGEIIDSPAENKEQEEQQCKKNIQQSYSVATAVGSLSADFSRFISEAINPKIPWEEEIISQMLSVNRDDYSFSRPNRRYTEFIMPSLSESETVGPVCIAIDTSGSMSIEKLSQIYSELKNVLETVNPEKVYVIECDSKVKRVNELDKFEDWDFKNFKGGGGTDLRPPFRYIKENDLEIDSMIYFTDFHISDEKIPQAPVDFDMHWICLEKLNFLKEAGVVLPRFGKVYEYS